MAHKLVDAIASRLKKANNILVATHIYPDVDALGSQLGLGAILESLGKKVVLYSEERAPELYNFLPGEDRLDPTPPDPSEFDCAVALDCGDSKRLGRAMESILSIHPLVVIDHHMGHDGFGDLNWVDATRAATGEMVYDLAAALQTPISHETAYNIYAAIVSDTGSFKYSSTTADTFRIAQELVALGVKPAKVAGKLFDNFTVNRMQLLKEVLATLEFFGDGQIAIIHVTDDMYERTGTSQPDTETFVNYPRSLTPVKVAVFIKETKKGVLSVSMRSKGKDCDVAGVAQKFGGGGHRNAAGFKHGSSEITVMRDMVIRELLPLVQGN